MIWCLCIFVLVAAIKPNLCPNSLISFLVWYNLFIFLQIMFRKPCFFILLIDHLFFIFHRLLLCCFFPCLSLGRSLHHTLAPLQSLGLFCKSFNFVNNSYAISWYLNELVGSLYHLSFLFLLTIWSMDFNQLCPILLSWCWSCACPSSAGDICFQDQSKSSFFVIRHTLGEWLLWNLIFYVVTDFILP